MAITRGLFLMTIFGYAFAHTEKCTGLQAEVTVEIQHDGQVGSGIMLMTSNPASCADLVSSNSIGNFSNSINATPTTTTTMSNKTSITSNLPFNTPPSIGASRTQIINATSTDQHYFQTTIGPSQIMTDTTGAQNQSGHSNFTKSQSSAIAGSGTCLDVKWSHIVFGALAIELMTRIL
ncbi:hypothetical protein BKA65DRAFT_489999 [Rhexocercosporidium sp. MPI-PUGE-AT-0058]|nr:hypothetical protein BKA65DRAFT_489999 [Rhexocercosporidium sp. MPI-PUGE-AT-0058]